MITVNQAVVDYIDLHGPMAMRCAKCGSEVFRIYLVNHPPRSQAACARCEAPVPDLDKQIVVVAKK